MSAPAATVDSLVKFSYKKKFSFTNRKSSVDEQQKEQPDDADKAVKTDGGKESTGSGSDEEDLEPTTVAAAKAQHKGSARLKESGDSSDSSSGGGKKAKKKKQKPKKDAKKRVKKAADDESSDEEDEGSRKVDRQLDRLYKMFPTVSQAHVKQMFIKRDFDAKSCIDTLLEEVNAKRQSDQDEEAEIEEWSDGDPDIKARNEQARAKAKLKLTKASPPSTSLQVKRKSQDDLVKEPSKKKARKLVIISDDDDEAEDASVKSKQSSSSSSSLNSLASSGAEKASTAKKSRKTIIRSSSDQDEDDDDDQEHERTSKKSKKHKKEKKKSKKKSRRDDDDYASDQSDNEFAKQGADYDTDDSADEQDKMTDEEKAAILAMFNDAPMEDIQSMINISTKRLETLLSLRPFQNYEDLHQRLSQKALYPIIISAKEIIYARSIVSNMLGKCEKISQKMQKEVASLIESSNSSDSAKSSSLEIKFQPKNLNTNLSLKPYQLIGLNWLCLMHKENINGILADEMGLGKTCQTISFLAHLLETNKKLLHLIIVPPSTLDNWVREISTWCPSFYFTVYQGNLEERRRLRFDILNNRFEQPLNGILTTYGLISSTNEDKAFFKKLSLEYCVFDEAHMLKNMNSQRYQSLIQIKSRRKLLLTGTPLQNNLVELMSLLYFVMPNMFHHQTQYINKIFASKPANVDKDTFYSEKIAQAKGIMAPFILRRLKTDVLKQLPKKVEEVIQCEMTQKQQKEYTALVNYYKQRKDELELLKIEKAKKESDVKDEGAQLALDAGPTMSTSTLFKRKGAAASKATQQTEDSSSNILMELRKAANHPLLRRSVYNNDKIKQMAHLVMKESSPDTVYDYVVEDLSVMSDFQIHKICPLYKGLKSHALDNAAILNSGKFVILDSLLAEKKEMGDRVLLFSQFVIMLDIVEEFLKIKGYKYFRLDGTTAVNERQDMIDCFNNDSEIFIFLLSTKAGGVGINLTAANVVIMHDIDFNPFNDKQAEDRCHRVGQTREVQVYKLISKNSIDETMLKIQKTKLELGADISGESGGDQTTSKADMVSMLKEALKL